MPVPQHPGNTQGLGAPTQAPQPQGNQNPYYTPNVALGQANGRMTGENELAMAQAAQAGAQAGKTQAEAQMLQQMQGLVPPQAEYSPEEVQAGQISDGLMRGELKQEQLAAMVQNGEVSPGVADAAMAMAQRAITEDQGRMEQSMGLGAI